MSWEKDKPYHDAIGRVWWIVAEANVKGDTILAVAMRMTGAPNIYAIAVVDSDRPDTASVLLDDGFTTIYKEDERMTEMWLCPACGEGFYRQCGNDRYWCAMCEHGFEIKDLGLVPLGLDDDLFGGGGAE